MGTEEASPYKDVIAEYLAREFGPGGEPAPFIGLRPPRHASSFADAATADRLIVETVERHWAEVETWLSTERARLMVEASFDETTGIAVDAESAGEVSGVRVVLARTSETEEGFRLHNGYPQRSRVPRTDLPALRQLTGAYFHQDWDEDYGSHPGVITTFLRESGDLAALLPDEIARVRGLPEATLDRLVDDLGCEFTLRDGETWGEWLDDIDRRARTGC